MSENAFVDLNAIMRRLDIKRKDLANAFGVVPSQIANILNGVSKPTYNAIVELIKLGATADEIFGKELATKLKENSVNINDLESLNDKIDARIFELKSKGII